MGVLFALLTGVMYAVLTWVFKSNNSIQSWMSAFLLFFLLSELSTFIIGGSLPLFGLFESMEGINRKLDAGIFIYRKNRDFALSISALVSSLIASVSKLFLLSMIKKPFK